MKNYEPDDGALTRDQIEQIRDKAKQADEIELVDFIRLAVLEEREACAKVCESIDMEAFGVLPVRTVMITSHCAEAIRARGDK